MLCANTPTTPSNNAADAPSSTTHCSIAIAEVTASPQSSEARVRSRTSIATRPTTLAKALISDNAAAARVIRHRALMTSAGLTVAIMTRCQHRSQALAGELAWLFPLRDDAAHPYTESVPTEQHPAGINTGAEHARFMPTGASEPSMER